MRYFEKISKYKDRDDIILPVRSTIGSAGYDFFAIEDINIYPIFPISFDTGFLYKSPELVFDEANYTDKKYEDIEPCYCTLVKTGIKAYMPEDEYLGLFIRSSLAMKYGLSLVNNCGIVDSSYYNNSSNEGEIGFLIINFNTKTYHIKKGDKIGQGIFMKFLITKDDNVNIVRQGGFGSTGI